MASPLTGKFDVIVIGAGPVGLALAIEMGSRGVRCLVVERGDRGYAPRAKLTNVRSRTHLRRWGIADVLADASPLGTDYPSDIVFATRLAGPELARFSSAFNMKPERNALYPEHAQWIPQYTLEKVMTAHAQTLDTVSILRADFKTVVQDDASVEAYLAMASGEEVKVRGRYLVGADGARSTVRGLIGATMSGEAMLSRNHNIIFRAPGLAAAHTHGRALMYWQVNDDLPSIMGPLDEDDVWYCGLTGIPDGIRLTDEEAQATIRRASGIDMPYQILSQDQWVASRLIADRYRRGRIFLAGDACHLHPPFGGYGMNMGIADGADLGWKLAAVLQGWGGDRLLDSYEAERRAVHEWIMDEAVANHAILGRQLFRPGLEKISEEGDRLRAEVGTQILHAKQREFFTLGAVLGLRYRESPAIKTEREDMTPLNAERYEPCSQPGCLAPHLWLEDQVSIYDRFGSGLTLLARTGAATEAAEREARTLGVPLQTVHLPDRAEHLYPTSLTLVRPDQYVCWRGETWEHGVLSLVTGRVARHSDEPVLAHDYA